MLSILIIHNSDFLSKSFIRFECVTYFSLTYGKCIISSPLTFQLLFKLLSLVGFSSYNLISIACPIAPVQPVNPLIRQCFGHYVSAQWENLRIYIWFPIQYMYLYPTESKVIIYTITFKPISTCGSMAWSFDSKT